MLNLSPECSSFLVLGLHWFYSKILGIDRRIKYGPLSAIVENKQYIGRKI